MAEWSYDDNWGAGPYDDWYGYDQGGADNYLNSDAYKTFTSWGDPTGPGSSGDTSGNWLSSVLGSLGSVGSFLGKNAGTLGPLLSGAGSLASGAIGSNAANDAARLQSQALNRGIDLQTAQWLQQQQNLAPYLQAGQQGLSQLQQLAGREQPGAPPASTQVQRSWYDAQMPDTRPGWYPQEYQGPQAPQAGDYRWNPGQGPQAANYRYTPGAVPTLSGQELLANDPGYQFRMDESRKALEGSAAARGDLLSGGNLKALQSRSQDLASQEYGQAWNRASQQAQMREQWNQYAQAQGWTQAQAEAAFREGLAQQASQQGWNQALGGQQNQFGQGLQSAQWNQGQQQQWQAEQYKRQLEQNQLRYGRDFAENEANYGRNQAAYKQQLAQYMLPYEMQSTLANLGGQAVGMYGTQGQSAANAIATLLGRSGEAEAMGPAGSALNWQRALTGAGNQIRPLLSSLNA